ncbi:MAG: hypothetical protein M0P26_07730 [Bacteroidales bacterium]|nr:hypothetical protein [Bacteroidales bacterium]
MKIYFILLLVLIFNLIGCEKKELPFISPTLEITSIKVLSAKNCMINFKVDKGRARNLKSFYFEFTDLTIISQEVIKRNIDIKDENVYQDSVIVDFNSTGHDFRCIAKLESDKNTFRSNPVFIRLSADYTTDITKSVDFVNLEPLSQMLAAYCIEKDNIGFVVNAGEKAYIKIYYKQQLPRSLKYELKLDDKISIPVNTNEFGENIHESYADLWVKIPDNVPAGDYEIYLYVSDNDKRYKYISLKKLRVLSSKVTRTEITDFPIYYNTHFLLGSKLFYMSKMYTEYAPVRIKVIDLKTYKWEDRKNFEYPEYKSNFSSVNQLNFKYNNRQYIINSVCSNSDFELNNKIYRYDDVSDSWEFITDYPGKGTQDFYLFVIGDCLYMGSNRIGDMYYAKDDFWEYDFIRNEWEKKNNLPSDMHGKIISSCNSNTSGYSFTIFRELWKYSSENDSWTKLSTLEGGPYSRDKTTLLFYNNALYIAGGNTYEYGTSIFPLADIWHYNLTTNKWTLKFLQFQGFASQFDFGNVVFFFENKMIVATRSNDDKPVLYSIEL